METGYDARELQTALKSCPDNPSRMARALEAARGAIAAERGFVAVPKGADDVQILQAAGFTTDNIWDTGEISQTIIRKVLSDGEAVKSNNASDDPRFADQNSVILSGLRSVMCVPFKSAGRLVGLLYLDNRMVIGAFSRDDLQVVREIAELVSLNLTA
jgi:GAF domain-containing protein